LTNDKLGQKGYPTHSKASELEEGWPYKSGTEEYMESAFWMPGEASQKKVEELKKVFL
jgi:hypothetical protein